MRRYDGEEFTEYTMTSALRVIDGGIGKARAHIATGAALARHHAQSGGAAILRIFRSPPAVLVGRHQATWDAIVMETCLADGVEIARRTTGGAAVYLDDGVVGWDFIISRADWQKRTLSDDLRMIAERIRNELERQFGEEAFPSAYVTAMTDTTTLHVQGFQRFAPAAVQEDEYLSQTPRPADKFLRASPPDIVALFGSLAAGLSEQFDLMPEASETTPVERALAGELLEREIGDDAYVFAIDDPVETGLRIAHLNAAESQIAVYLRTGWVDGIHRIFEATIAGDFILCPAQKLADLERAVAGKAVSEIDDAFDRFFAGVDIELARVTVADLKKAVLDAAAAQPKKDLLPLR